MGRPIRKSALGTYTGAGNTGIRCEAFLSGSNQTDVFVVKQVGSKRYKVEDTSSGVTGRAKLVAGAPAASGEMRITGYVAGTGASGNPATSGGTAKYASKITQRRFIDSAGIKYKWTLVNDSTQDYIELTAI